MKRKILVKDVPYTHIDYYELFEGDISEVADRISGIRKKVEEAYHARAKNVPKENFTPLEDYKEITISIDSDYDGDTEISLSVYREETDVEYQKRLNDEAKIKELKYSAKERNKQASEKREKTLYEKLKKKYGN